LKKRHLDSLDLVTIQIGVVQNKPSFRRLARC
jgi:hypothetical protein